LKNELYLLTGAAGFLGSNISRKLILMNKKVRALVLPGDPAAAMVPDEAEIVYGDILDMDTLETFFTAGNDEELIVIHCASIVAIMPEYNSKVYDVNVRGTQNIIDMCVKYDVKKLVYISSTSAIPELEGNAPITEVDRYVPDKIIGFYGQTKAEATQLVLDAVQKHGLDASIVFPSGIYGPNDYSFGYLATFASNYAKEKISFAVKGEFNSVDVRDLSDGIISCTNKGVKGQGYIMASRTISFYEMLNAFKKYMDLNKINIIFPMWTAAIMASFAALQSRITKKPPWLTKYTLYNLSRNNNYSSQKAADELGYKTRPFEETIKDTVLWLKEEKRI